jgi:hypothetical protein
MPNQFGTESNKAPSFTRHEAAQGVRINAGPYIGIVKNNVDPTRSGTLQVWIAEMGGKPDEPGSWLKVRYSTPFYGVTPQDTRSKGQDFQGSPHSYGMWFVPPDLGVQVLCTFVNGDPFKGYWFACVPEWPSLHMVPGRSQSMSGKAPYPVVEFNDQGAETTALTDFFQKPVTKHDYQSQIFEKQGLLQDPDRGPGTSSAFRETPSRVFGISTPGAELGIQEIPGEDTQGVTEQIKGRRGGHMFVMDDGDSTGKNALYRLRSGSGHQIMMNDTKGFIHIINAAGTAWVELDSTGGVNVYSAGTFNVSANAGINLDSKGPVKIHGKTVDIKSDGPLNIEGKDINIKASGTAKLSSGKELNLKGSKALLTGDNCVAINGAQHVDIGGGCVQLGANATKAQAAGGATAPQGLPEKEPWPGHRGIGTGVTPLTAQPSYGSESGMQSSGNPYGATNNFGSSTVQQNYGEMPNNIPPVKYNTGLQGTVAGQASTAVQGMVGKTAYDYDLNSYDYRNIAQLTNFIYQSGGGYDATKLIGSDLSKEDKAKYTFTEMQCNPGMVLYAKDDKYAVGNANNFSVYTKPEDGIAAMMTIFDRLSAAGAGTANQLIGKYFLASNPNNRDVTAAVRFIAYNTGINGGTFLDLTNAKYRMTWASAVIQYLQGHMSYSFGQIATGCAISLGVKPSDFVNSFQPVTSNVQNGTNSPGTSKYTPVTTPGFSTGSGSGSNKSPSLLTTIATGVAVNVAGKIINNLTGGSSGGVNIFNNAVNSVTNTATNIISTGVGTVYNNVVGGTASLVSATGSIINTSLNGVPTSGGYMGINEQCTSFVQGCNPNIGYASGWKQGDSVTQSLPPPGTAIASGWTNGTYGANGVAGGTSAVNGVSVNHAAVLTGYVDKDKNPMTYEQAQADPGRVAGIQVSEQWAGSGGVRTSIKMNDQTTNNSGRRSDTVDAKGYYVITTRDKNGNVVSHTVNTKEAQAAQQAAQAKIPTPPDPADAAAARADAAKQDQEAAKAMDDRDMVQTNGTTESGQAGTRADSIENRITPNEFDVKQREIDNVTEQQEKLDTTIVWEQKVSESTANDINSLKLGIQGNSDRAQIFRDEQRTIASKQDGLLQDYNDGKISKSAYLAENQRLQTESQKAGNNASMIERQNVRLEKDLKEYYEPRKELADAKVLDAQEQKTALTQQEATLKQEQSDIAAEQARAFDTPVPNDAKTNNGGVDPDAPILRPGMTAAGNMAPTSTVSSTGSSTYRTPGEDYKAPNDNRPDTAKSEPQYIEEKVYTAEGSFSHTQTIENPKYVAPTVVPGTGGTDPYSMGGEYVNNRSPGAAQAESNAQSLRDQPSQKVGTDDQGNPMVYNSPDQNPDSRPTSVATDDQGNPMETYRPNPDGTSTATTTTPADGQSPYGRDSTENSQYTETNDIGRGGNPVSDPTTPSPVTDTGSPAGDSVGVNTPMSGTTGGTTAGPGAGGASGAAVPGAGSPAAGAAPEAKC